jgi:thymidine kinase
MSLSKEGRLGRIYFYMGPMFSAKSTEVRRRLERVRLGRQNCVMVKYAKDTRYGKGPIIITHDGVKISSASPTKDMGGIRVLEAGTLLDLQLKRDEFHIGIDEGQFYPDLRDALDLWSREGRNVYVAALDGDYMRKPWPNICGAYPLATNIVKLHAVCMLCTKSPPNDAPYTIRITKDTKQELIGGLDVYKAACFACYLRHTGSPGLSPE